MGLKDAVTADGGGSSVAFTFMTLRSAKHGMGGIMGVLWWVTLNTP